MKEKSIFVRKKIKYVIFMKKVILSFFLTAFTVVNASAQNFQLHYDLGRHIYSTEEKGRQDVTATFEHFSADDLGSWFYFVDLDLDKDGAMGAYTEVSREFNIAKATESSSFAAHVEFNGGMGRAGSYQSAALFGGAWNGHNADFSTTYSVQAMYKQFFKQSGGIDAYASFQLTGVWSTTFANKACTFSGFIDLWRGENAINHHGQLIILTEPQLWWNITPKVSLGSELEISNNFVYNFANDKSFFINPTLAVKFNL